MADVRLTPFDPRFDLSILGAWLRSPHVARWWGDPEQALAAVQKYPAAAAALIEVDARRVGFVCWQTPSREELSAAGLDDLPDDLVDVDILIGDPTVLGQGVGPIALLHLLAKFRADGVRVVGLAAAAANVRALRAYEKAGLRLFREFREGAEVMRYFVKHLYAAA